MPIQPVTNHPIFEDGKPVLWPEVERPRVESQVVYATRSAWTYTHHPHLGRFGGRLWAMWSNGRVNEDRSGQRVMVASSEDFRHWTPPRVIAAPGLMPDGSERVLTAGGFHSHAGTLVAYFGDYGPRKEGTRLWAVAAEDGENWSNWLDMGVPVCPNFGPSATRSGRLIIPGNISFPYTDDPSGLSGWTMTGIYPPDMKDVTDDPKSFWVVAEKAGWSTAVCEGSFMQTDDGVLHMLLRAELRGFRWRLWQTDSDDDGTTWCAAVETEYTDCNAKFHLGRLPDGRFYNVGNPLAGNRWPLIMSLSEDGVNFDRHLILGEGHWPMPPEAHKPGEYGYPHTVVDGGYVHVLVSRQKQAIELLRVAVDDL